MRNAVSIALWIFSSIALAQEIPSTEGFSNGRQGLPAFAQEAWAATVYIERVTTKCPDKPDARHWGGGAVVQYDRAAQSAVVITNSHVMNGCGKLKISFGFHKSIQDDGTKKSGSFRVLFDNPYIDLAIVRVQLPSGVNPAVARLALPVSETPVLAIGFPNLNQRKTWNVKKPNGGVKQRYSTGYVRSVAPNYPVKVVGRKIHYAPVVIHSADNLPGSSGGPLINSNGEIVGLDTSIGRPKTPDGRSLGHDDYFYCANQPATATFSCSNSALSSEIILRELGKLN